MKQKKNELWKLDYLEAKFHNTVPRFNHTKKLLSAKNVSQLVKKLPCNQEDADAQILALKSEYFDRKYYAGHKKLTKEVTRVVMGDLKKFAGEALKSTIVDFFDNDDNMNLLITSKLIKMIMSTVLNTKILKQNPPDYISTESKAIILDKSNKFNPSAFFINNCQNNPILNNYISGLWNSKSIKPILLEIEWSFKLIRGGITKADRDLRDKHLKSKTNENGRIQDDEADDGSSDDSNNESSDESDDDSGDEIESHQQGSEIEVSNNKENSEVDFEEVYEKYAAYDNLVGDSDEEEEEKVVLDSEVDYNQVTDEEPSELDDEEDSFFEEDSSKETKDKSKIKKEKLEHKLPDLIGGYYSGGSDEEDDVDNDKVVKEITQARKNRRGQRARQKIWEKKYGKEAKHIKEERQKIASEREQRQREFEERERKRQLKAKLAIQNAPSGANTQPLGARLTGSTDKTASDGKEIIHPSWQAKKLAEEKQKNVKFAGKKIKFD